MTDALATIVAGTADPAFAVDSCGRIMAWNDGAEQFLGYSRGEAVGERCFELLGGRDVFGNRFCCRTCAVRDMTSQQEPVNHFEVSFRSSSGTRTDARVTVMVVPSDGASEVGVVHVLQPIAPAISGLRPAVVRDDQLAELTPRELEVLRLIADGRNTAEVAAELFIGAATVRHHSQSILRKLGVHSRLEAAAVFHRAVASY